MMQVLGLYNKNIMTLILTKQHFLKLGEIKLYPLKSQSGLKCTKAHGGQFSN